MAHITFEMKNSESGGWWVLCNQVRVGHIRKDPTDGFFRYFYGENNMFTVSDEDKDLDALQRRVIIKLIQATPSPEF